MKYRRTEAFLRDLSRLAPEHRRMFKAAVYENLLPALDAGAHTGKSPWPKRLRVHKLSGTEVYSLTWNFASPDGRATFMFATDDAGEPVLIWRRVGDHRIYSQP